MACKEQYTMENLSISCLTWNIETTWPNQDLTQLLSLQRDKNEKLEDHSTHPDIYFICLQEVKSQPQNMVMDTLFEEPWTTAFRDTLAPFGYVRISGERLQGIVTSIFVLRHHLPHLRDIHTAVTRTGLGGIWGNKGGVSIRFSLYGCSFCVVNCHLAAHDSGFEERCSNYNSIIDEVFFPVNLTSSILFHDYVFWLGDLNFRLTGDDSAEEISRKIRSNDLESLLQKDELRKAQKSQVAFSPLTEGFVSFPPTYKYLKNSHDYDLSRRPAWTDRILHQVHVNAYENVKLDMEQLIYEAKKDYGLSDHKPVVADYVTKVFAEFHERCVTFKPIKEWIIGGVNTITYQLDADVATSPWDYIAMFKANFTSVHHYVTYSYAPHITRHNGDAGETSRETSSASSRSFQMTFNDELVQLPGLYVLLYYSAKYSSYLGMSEPFPVLENNA